MPIAQPHEWEKQGTDLIKVSPNDKKKVSGKKLNITLVWSDASSIIAALENTFKFLNTPIVVFSEFIQDQYSFVQSFKKDKAGEHTG